MPFSFLSKPFIWKIIQYLCLSSVTVLYGSSLFCLILVLFAQHIVLMTQVLIW